MDSNNLLWINVDGWKLFHDRLLKSKFVINSLKVTSRAPRRGATRADMGRVRIRSALMVETKRTVKQDAEGLQNMSGVYLIVLFYKMKAVIIFFESKIGLKIEKTKFSKNSLRHAKFGKNRSITLRYTLFRAIQRR